MLMIHGCIRLEKERERPIRSGRARHSDSDVVMKNAPDAVRGSGHVVAEHVRTAGVVAGRHLRKANGVRDAP
jgi:hypothetical protein